MRTISFFLLCAAAAWAQPAPKNPALEGLDPVLLTEGHDTEGKESLTMEHGRFLYRFASEETRERFKKDPERYAIQLDGACARMGPPVGGDPGAYVVYNSRIYILGSQECYRHFKANPAKYLESEQPKIAWNPTADARAKGQALIGKALAVMGGAQQFAGVHSYLETRNIETARGAQTVARFALLPASFGTETTSGDNRFGTLILPDTALRVFRGEGARVPESFAVALRNDWARDLLPILVAAAARDPKTTEFEAFYAGREAGSDLITVKLRGAVSRLRMDPASGLVQSVDFRGRGQEREFGEVRVTFSDYRDAGGFKLPFRATGTFDGQPLPDQSWTVDSYRFNSQEIAARLKTPEKIRE